MRRPVTLVRAPAPTPEVTSDAPVDVAALFRAHERDVMRWAARLGGLEIDVDDVVQEVFLVANRRMRSFDGRAAVTTWLFRTTAKVVLAARRKQRLRRWLSRTPEAAVATMSTAGPTPGEAFERRREIADVYRVLDLLPEKQRRVLILFEIEGLSTQEIAALVGAKVATVRVWLFRARARFLEERERSLDAVTKEAAG
jgi:RNA polymerase sigma-70 factor (ECF subfamily)